MEEEKKEEIETLGNTGTMEPIKEETVETPVVETPAVEEPIVEPAVEDTPVESPIVEPVVEAAPVVEETPVETPAEPTSTETPVESAPVEPAPETPAVEPAKTEEPKKKSKLPLIIMIIIILALGGFAVWYFVLGGNGSKKEQKEAPKQEEKKEEKKKEEKKEEQKEEETKEEPKENLTFNDITDNYNTITYKDKTINVEFKEEGKLLYVDGKETKLKYDLLRSLKYVYQLGDKVLFMSMGSDVRTFRIDVIDFEGNITKEIYEIDKDKMVIVYHAFESEGKTITNNGDYLEFDGTRLTHGPNLVTNDNENIGICDDNNLDPNMVVSAKYRLNANLDIEVVSGSEKTIKDSKESSCNQ